MQSCRHHNHLPHCRRPRIRHYIVRSLAARSSILKLEFDVQRFLIGTFPRKCLVIHSFKFFYYLTDWDFPLLGISTFQRIFYCRFMFVPLSHARINGVIRVAFSCPNWVSFHCFQCIIRYSTIAANTGKSCFASLSCGLLTLIGVTSDGSSRIGSGTRRGFMYYNRTIGGVSL